MQSPVEPRAQRKQVSALSRLASLLVGKNAQGTPGDDDDDDDDLPRPNARLGLFFGKASIGLASLGVSASGFPAL